MVTPGGSIGTNGDLTVNGPAEIGASLWAAQRVGVNADGHVVQDVYVGGEASANALGASDFFFCLEAASASSIAR